MEDDAECAKHIFKETEKVTGNGFTAWRGWTSNCRGRSLTNYTSDCFEENVAAYPNSIEFGVTNSPMQMTSNRALTTRRSKRRRYPRKGKTYKKHNQSRNTNVESIKIFECDNSFVKCEYRPQSADYQYRCKFENSEIPQKLKRSSRQKYSSTTEAAIEVIKIYDCGNFYMKCEYQPNSETYPYRCKFISSVIPYQLF